MANSSSGQIVIYSYMYVVIYLLNCSDEDEVCDVIQAHITDLNNIDYNKCLFSMND